MPDVEDVFGRDRCAVEDVRDGELQVELDPDEHLLNLGTHDVIDASLGAKVDGKRCGARDAVRCGSPTLGWFDSGADASDRPKPRRLARLSRTLLTPIQLGRRPSQTLAGEAATHRPDPSRAAREVAHWRGRQSRP